MKPIYQDPEKPECGAACLAMLANISIEEARTKLYGLSKPTRVGRKKMLAALKDYRLLPLTSKAKAFSRKYVLAEIKGNALIYGATLIGRKRKESKHWMVWDGKARCLRDPLGFADPLRVTSATEFK